MYDTFVSLIDLSSLDWDGQGECVYFKNNYRASQVHNVLTHYTQSVYTEILLENLIYLLNGLSYIHKKKLNKLCELNILLMHQTVDMI